MEFTSGDIGALDTGVASFNDCVGACGVKDVQIVKEFSSKTSTECAAIKVKVVYEDCFFAVGLPPLVQVTTAAPDEHTFDALVRPITEISNGQCAYFRVSFGADSENTCYPQCGGGESGRVAFNILAYQGGECQ